MCYRCATANEVKLDISAPQQHRRLIRLANARGSYAVCEDRKVPDLEILYEREHAVQDEAASKRAKPQPG